MLSPQSSRCLPRSQTSPARLTGSAGSLGNIVGIGEARIADGRAGRRVSSSPKPVSDRSKPSACQVAELERQQLRVPAGVQRQLVVGDDVGALLRLAQPGKLDDRHVCHAELAGRQQPPVSGDDAVLAVDQDRVGPAELADGDGWSTWRIRRRGLDLESVPAAGIAGASPERSRTTMTSAARPEQEHYVLLLLSTR